MCKTVINHLIQEMLKKLSEIESTEIGLNDDSEPVKAVPHSAGDLSVLIENLSHQWLEYCGKEG